MLFYILFILGGIALDQITKYFAVSFLSSVTTVPVIPHVFHLTYVENTGAAFSLFDGQQLFLILVTIGFVCGLSYFFYIMPKTKRYFDINLALSMIMSGAIGNLIDRIRLNYVIDFFDVRLIGFAIFNIADILVVSGCVLAVISVLRNKELMNDPPNLKKKRRQTTPVKNIIPNKKNVQPLDKKTTAPKAPAKKHRQNLEPRVLTKIEQLPEHLTPINFDPSPPEKSNPNSKKDQ